MYSGKTDCIRAKVVVFVQKWLYSGKWLHSDESGCIHAKWFFLAKFVVIGQNWLYSGKVVVLKIKVVVIGQSGVVRAKVAFFG